MNPKTNNDIQAWPLKVVLEAGVNHEGSLTKALEMVEQASNCGVHSIKFQTYKANMLAAEVSPRYWDASKESTQSQRELFSKYDSFGVDEYKEIAQHCSRLGIVFATTFFDEELLDEMDELVSFHKIASADITNYRLIREIAKKNKPILLSTGAATINEIQSAVKQIKSINGELEITLLHCVLNYPTEYHNANLNRILALRDEFPALSVGYSDHTLPDYSKQAICIAYLLGATVIETHFTLDKNLPGNDHYHALDPSDVLDLRKQLNDINNMQNYEEERFIESQNEARMYARRGVYARKDLQAGAEIYESDLICLRPIPPNGFHASELEQIIGKVSLVNYRRGEPIAKNAIS